MAKPAAQVKQDALAIPPMNVAVIYDEPRSHTIRGQRLAGKKPTYDVEYTFVPGLNVLPSELWKGLQPHVDHMLDRRVLHVEASGDSINGQFFTLLDEPKAIRCAGNIMDVALLTDFRNGEVSRGNKQRSRVLTAIDAQLTKLTRKAD